MSESALQMDATHGTTPSQKGRIIVEFWHGVISVGLLVIAYLLLFQLGP